ncbi:MAG: CpsD/CapB family tyrosine-protein kinase [Proteobacteria bacterium]|nr:CpsD/CapB family tyrosine-protein kinase [Pseudomonadota bacterium]
MHSLISFLSAMWNVRNTFFFLMVILPLCTFIYFSNQKYKIGSNIGVAHYSLTKFSPQKFKNQNTKIKVKDNNVKVEVFSFDLEDAENILEKVNSEIIADVSYSILSELQLKVQHSNRKMQSLQSKKNSLVSLSKSKKVKKIKRQTAISKITAINSIYNAELKNYQKQLDNLESFNPEEYIKVLDKKPLPNDIFWVRVFGSLVIAIVISIIVALTKSKLNKAFVSCGEIKEELGLKILDGLAHFKRLDYIDNELVSNHLRLSKLTEIARVFKYIDSKNKKVISVVSSVRNEGNSSLAYALAEHASRNNSKAILVDLDLRAKGLSGKRGYNIIDWDLENDSDFTGLKEKILQLRTNLDFLPSLKDEKSLRKLKSTKELKRLFKYLKTEYDYVFIDTSAVTSANVHNIDSVVVSSIADGIIVNYLLNKTPKEKLLYSVEKLNMFEGRILAIVTNHRYKRRFKDELLGICDTLEKINKSVSDKLRDRILRSDILNEE